MPKLYSALVSVLIAVCCASKAPAAPALLQDSRIARQMNLPIYEWVDKSKPAKAIIIAVHGLTLYSTCWDKYARHLAATGMRVFAIDQRGFGQWKIQATKYNGTSKIEIGQSQQDLLDLITTLRQRHPGRPLFLLGESVGSNMSLLLLSEHPELADGAILSALCYKTRIHPKARWIEDFAKEMVKPNSPLNLTPYAAPYLTNDPVVEKSCDADSLINRTMTPAELIKIDILNDNAIASAKKLPVNFPLLLVSGSRDAMFKSIDLPNLVPKFGTKNVELRLFMGEGHLLLEHQSPNPQIVTFIDEWLSKQLKTVNTRSVSIAK